MDSKIVTREQALAFVEALTGYELVWTGEDITDEKQKSPHAMTHLQAVLGQREVPGSSIIRTAFGEHGPQTWQAEAVKKTRDLALYFIEVGKALLGGTTIKDSN